MFPFSLISLKMHDLVTIGYCLETSRKPRQVTEREAVKFMRYYWHDFCDLVAPVVFILRTSM